MEQGSNIRNNNGVKTLNSYRNMWYLIDNVLNQKEGVNCNFHIEPVGVERLLRLFKVTTLNFFCVLL